MMELTYDIEIYRQKLLKAINDGDTVIELGSHVGKTTELIAKRLTDGKILALDNSPEAISLMNDLSKKYENLKFISGDVRLHSILKEVYKLTNSCNILSIDLGGGYHPDTVFKVYYIYSSVFKPKYTIIRNRGLIDFVNSSKTFEPFNSKNGWIESSGDSGIPKQIKEFNLWTDSLKK
ncbi:MAG: class I SAM-dependent methyltransferase [Methanobrevibacter sp.]|jgi:hypothetical protein|nr:class I SAM-dependent methyltransferase [Methanobrevibacter sp.]